MTDVTQVQHVLVVRDLKRGKEDLDHIKLIVVCLSIFQRRELEESRQELEEERRRLMQQRQVGKGAQSQHFELFWPKHKIVSKLKET